MANCSNCGAELNFASKFCSNCGTAQDEAARFETVEPAPADFSPDIVRSETQPPSPPPFPSMPPYKEPLPPAAQRKIENNMIKSVIATVCCCIPFGVVGIIYASRVDTLSRCGDYAAAEEAAKKAGLWSNLAIGVGILAQIIVAVITTYLFKSGDLF
jgi:hypothetical protein